jgi:predicted RNA-binding protein with PIN domain
VAGDSPAVRWIVDGMNVIGSRPDGWWRDRTAAMERLAARLDAFAAATGEPVTVVLDGRERPIPAERVDVRFATRRGRDAADADIAALVRADPDAAGVWVVTSDAALAREVGAAGARVVGAGEFLRRLDALDAAQDSHAAGRSSRA